MDETPIGRFVTRLAGLVAMAGGIALVFAALITVASVIGRSLIGMGLSPVPGDVELVQAAMLFSVFAFLPWCHLERGHAIVAILTDRFPVRIAAGLEALWDALMLVAAGFIAWRLGVGLMDKLGNREATFILGIPVWIVYALGLLGAVVGVLVAAYCAVRSARNAGSARPIPPVGGGSE